MPLSTDTGGFWFFRPENLELTLKVLDGRPLGGHFWVFWSSLSTVGWTATITDRDTGWQRFYRNPPGLQTAGSDTAAFSETTLGERLLFIGAHPDDEVLVAPILGEVCAVRGASCRLLVATRGERGHCLLPGGCLPNLVTVRAGEMAAAAALYGAALEMWDLEDGAGSTAELVANRWSTQSGDREALLDRLRATVDSFAPDTVLTLDPSHGTTGHPDHQALGELVLEALANRPGRLRLATLASRLQWEPGPSFEPPLVLDRRFLGLDATVERPGGRSGWDFLLENAALHPSQLSAAVLAGLAANPPQLRRIQLEVHGDGER